MPLYDWDPPDYHDAAESWRCRRHGLVPAGEPCDQCARERAADRRANCEWCHGTGERSVNIDVEDGEAACPECCWHPDIQLLSGPGYGCMDCGQWFPDRDAVEDSRWRNAD